MKVFIRQSKAVAVGALLAVAALAAHAQEKTDYYNFVMAENVEITYVRGEIRFCESKNVRGLVCGFEQKILGKTSFAARDWWSPETYVQARTGLNEFTLYDVIPDGPNLIIRYRP